MKYLNPSKYFPQLYKKGMKVTYLLFTRLKKFRWANNLWNKNCIFFIFFTLLLNNYKEVHPYLQSYFAL